MRRRLPLQRCASTDCGGALRPVTFIRAPDGQGRTRRFRACAWCHEQFPPLPGKYHNVPKRDAAGRMHQSGAEADRMTMLLAAAASGTITNLRDSNRHPKETYRFNMYATPIVETLLAAIGEVPPEQLSQLRELRLVEFLARKVRESLTFLHTYTPDASYDDDRGVHHVEDVKGAETERWRLNRILMRLCFGIEVEVPKTPRGRGR